MNRNSPPSGGKEAERHDAAAQAPVRQPLYQRPWFWMILGMLLGLLVLLLLLSGGFLSGGHARPGQDAALSRLLELQRAQNSGLEEEIARLKGLMNEDPCTLSGLLGPAPDQSPVAPSYGGPGRGAPGKGTAPDGDAPGKTTDPDGDAPGKTTDPDGDARLRPIAPSAPPPSTVAELMDQATVFVISVDGDTIGTGSGFFVAPGVIATNRHVAQSAHAEIIVGNKALGGMQPVQLIAYSELEDRDYALLRIDPSLASRVPYLQIAPGASRTERVSAWGFPGYIGDIDPKLEAMFQGDFGAVPEVVYSEGVVSVVLDTKPRAILHTASLSQGNSGGPLITPQGVVVGINTFIRRADQSYSQTNIALPGADLASFMREHGVNPVLASATPPQNATQGDR